MIRNVTNTVQQRRSQYKTASNRSRRVKTPGGFLNLINRGRHSQLPRCGEAHCKAILKGYRHSKSSKRTKKSHSGANRAYGGMYCHKCLKNRIILAHINDTLREKYQLAKIAATN